MSFVLLEKYQSGDGETGITPRQEYVFYVASTDGTDNTDNFAAVYTFAVGSVPTSDTHGNQLGRLAWKRAAPGVWEFYASYQSEGQFRLTEEHQFSFNTAGGTTHITEAKSHVQTYDKTGPISPTDFDGRLGMDDDHTARGIDIDVAAFNFQTTLYLPVGVVNNAYVDLLETLTDTVSAADFTVAMDGISKTFPAGSCRLLGAQGAIRAYGDWEITLNFSSLKNVTGVTIGEITGIDSNGWDILWVTYKKQVDTGTFESGSVPDKVYVDQVYSYENWAGLIP